VRGTAARILRSGGVPAHNDLAEVRALYEWVLANIRFTKDPVDHETISDARWTLLHRIGDCDDINAVLLPALFGVTGHPVRLITISNHPADPRQFTHIYCEVRIGQQWIPIDAARSNARFGVGPTRFFRKRAWDLREDRFQDLRGLGGERVQMSGWADELGKAISAGVDATQRIIGAVKGVYIQPKAGVPGGAIQFQTPSGQTYQVTGSSFGVSPVVWVGLGGLGLLLLLRK
jgi:transglutaminase-like putative cysteine protease